MKLKLAIRTEIKVVVAIFGLLALIAFTDKKREGIVCKDIAVRLENEHENHFVDEADIVYRIEKSGQQIRGASFDEINLRLIENKLRQEKHVRRADLYTDLKGNLIATVELRRPIARLVSESGPGAYVSEEGIVMPVSERYTSRVVLVSGAYVRTLLAKGDLSKFDEGKALLEMINFINDDRFWRAQVAQIDLDEQGRARIYPQVTSQVVEFGPMQNIEEKFNKLMVFYKDILPQKGWTRYSRVNVEFQDQVIAE
ncbi:MAG: cell division protein FtsQ [Cyclobacteriaceae bacterium]|nr:cell division protein FtsQ [Cyclobacteriaceae bacterium]